MEKVAKRLFSSYSHWLAALAMFSLTIGLGYFVQQHEFWKIISLYAPLFFIYLLVCTQSPITNPRFPLRFWLSVAILLRFILLFSVPNLSNDVYRFIWDGRLLVQGYNPFEHLPLFYLENHAPVPGVDRMLFEAFGAKNTFSSYPPLAQAQFSSACWIFPNSIFGAVVVMKLWLIAFEIGTIFLLCRLLRHFQLPEKNVLWYALNPLILLEIMGNLHFEGAMIFFLLLALWLIVKNFQPPSTNNLLLSAIAFSLSISAKLLTFIFLPFLIKRLGWGRSLLYFSIVGFATICLFLPFASDRFISNFSESLSLYFQKLEFNASMYYFLRWIFFEIKGYNFIATLGPLLGTAAGLGILTLAFFEKVPPNSNSAEDAHSPKWRQATQSWLYTICIYLACTTTLHPWYLALPIALCVFTKWRFPIVWSGLIFLTYVNYSYLPYRENLWLVGIEYATVTAWFIFEWKTLRKNE